MDKVAILSGAIGVFIILASLLLSIGTDSYIPGILGFSIGFVLIIWKHIINFFSEQQKNVQTRTLSDEWEGKEKIEEIKEIVMQSNGDLIIRDGVPTYINILKYHLAQLGFAGLQKYRPKNTQVFGPYGIFMMEITPDPVWDRPRMYAMLSLKGPNAGEYIGNIEANSWRQAKDELVDEGNAGLLNSKFIELKPSLQQAALQQGARLA